MKSISIVVPTYNEEKNIKDIYERITGLFNNELKNYELQLLFIDNFSQDATRMFIEELAERDKRVQAIFNASNFGFTKSTFYGLTQAEGDCAVLIFADMQDPPEVIPQFVKEWENGYKIVVGIKNKSKESKIKYFLRACYYKFISAISENSHIKQFDGFGLYDRDFIRVLRKLDDPLPYLRGIIAEIGYRRKEVYYEQEARKKGKSNFNFFRLYDLAMLGVTSSSKILMRFATLIGGITAVVSLIVALVTFILKLINWESFNVGMAAVVIGIFFIGAVQLFFLGLLGEYVLNMNTRIMRHPLVVEEKRINLKRNDDEKDEEGT